MDSESQELIQEHIPQTEDYEETPSTKDNLPTEPEREDDRGAVSNLTFLNAGQVRRDPEIYDSMSDDPEIQQILSSRQPEEDGHSGTTKKDNEPQVKVEENPEDLTEPHTNHDTEGQEVVEQPEPSNPFADQDLGDFQTSLEESAFRTISAGNLAVNESQNGNQGASGFESTEESREERGESHFFHDIHTPPENNPFDSLHQEVGTTGLDSAEYWPTENPEETQFQLGEEDSPPRNPFDAVSEDPEFGQSIFGTEGAFDAEDRPDPESQGYTLLQNEDDCANDDQFDPEMGNTSADVHDAQQGDNMTSSHESQQNNHHDEQVAAFSQVHEPLSQGVTGLEFVAHQLVDPSDDVPEEMSSERLDQKDREDESGERWWSSNEIGEKFNFGQQEEHQSATDAFESNNTSEHLPVKTEDSQSDQFFQLLASEKPQQSSAPKDESEVQDLFDDESIAEIFPPEAKTAIPNPPTEASTPSVPAPVSSLFGETHDAPNLFNSTDNFPIAPIKEPTSSLEQQTSEAQVSENFTTEELVDDLDFIDDSEFMAAFGATPSATPATQPPPPRSAPTQLNGTSQTQTSRYLPQQTLPQQVPPQNPHFPQQTPISPPQSLYLPQQPKPVGTGTVQSSISSPSQPNTVPSQQSRTVSSRYAPSAAPRPAPATGSTTVSPQVPVTQPTWTQQPNTAEIAQPAWSQQQAAPSPPQPKQPPGRSASSFVTAKGAYASPYDLPPQIASKQKRHIPQPIPTYQQAAPPADVRSPQVAGPPPRAVSAQAHFAPPQSHRVVPPGPQTPNQYAPPNVASPPLRSPLVQGQGQNDPRRFVSPPTQYQQPPSQQSPQSQTYGARRESFPPPQQGLYGAPASPPMQQNQPAYAPRRMVSPTNPMSPQYQTTAPQLTQQSVSPPIRPPSTSRYATGSNMPPQRSVSTQQQRIPMDEPWQLHAPGPNFSQGQQRSVVSPPPQQQFPPPQPYQPRVASPLSHQHVTSQEHYGYLPPPQHQPLHPNQSPLGAQNQYQQPPQQQFPPPSESHPHFPPQEQYPHPQIGTQYGGNQHDDLPPHFEMERDDWEQEYGPEGIGVPPMFVPERNVIQTPEPLDDHQDPLTDVSPPRPWERAAAFQQQDPPKPSRPFSPYEPREPGTAPVIPQTISQQTVTERHRSVSPQVTRTSISSPKREFSMDKAQSYPSRKPPAHLRQATGPLPPRTLEEDFQFRKGGFPIVNFGFGGRMITMIPRTPHRVTMYGAAPLSVAGPITFSSLRDVIELPGFASTFPGPLFSATKAVKGKGKDIAKWLDDNLAHQERVRDTSRLDEQELHRIEDRKVLFRLLKLLVDHNGVLEGNADVEKSIKDILLPQIANVDSAEEQSFGVTASTLANTAATQSTTVDPNALATYNLTSDFLRSMRTFLMQGDRHNAIHKAVDQRMWGHALLIASSVNQTVWRETVEQFIRSELRGTETKDLDSLRFLYGLLGGEAEHAVNELLPPINRMVSSVHPSATTQTPRFGSWKESAGMVLLNKGSMDCSPVLLGLGTSLVKENRVEAGHACFLLVRFAAKFSAADAPDSHYTIIGADQSCGTFTLPQVLLSEVFEYSQSKFAPEGFLHLIPYKLWHAWTLVDYGYSDVAEKYCESIGATLQKEKRGSVFLTPSMIHMLRELTERLAESSQPGSTEKSSWFGKKSSRGDTFWKALETNLTKFVAGDEVNEEATPISNGKKSLEVQDHRFGRIASDTSLNRMTSMPNLRAQATTPIYPAFPQDAMRPPGTHSRYNTATSESRYTPGARYEQASAPGVPVQELDAVRSGYRPSSGYASPDPTNGGYSPYIPPQPPQPAPFTPTPEIAQPPVEEEPPSQPEEKPSHPRQESEESEKSIKAKDKKTLEQKPSGGWFGGWFKRGSAEQTVESTPGKPIKAKLGEESSFYYDKDLKRWINKKSGDVPAKAAPPPPPPKRAVAKTPSTAAPPVPNVATPSTPVASASATMTPPPAPTPSVSAPIATATPPTTMPTPSGLPPSRPASSALPAPPQKVDPLEALLAGRPASGARGAKKPARSRYVDVMNKK